MMLTEETTVPDSALPVEQFKAHLRLGTGFGEDNLQDSVLTGFLRAALAAIEARTGRVLLERQFALSLTRWKDAERQVLPVSPVGSLTAVVITDAAGFETSLDISGFRLDQDMHRARLCPVGMSLPSIPKSGAVKLSLTAGMAPQWGGLPADLCQAVLMLAAHYYEYRHEMSLGDGCMPFGVTSLIQRYRVTRLTLGAVQ
ncbi:MAG: head-tail connector protein [Paracoccaceae bacterium]